MSCFNTGRPPTALAEFAKSLPQTQLSLVDEALGEFVA